MENTEEVQEVFETSGGPELESVEEAAPEAVQATEEATSEPTPDEVAQAQTLNLLDGEPSEWMQALGLVAEKDGRETFSVPKEAVDSLPIEAKQLLYNLRGLVHKKARELDTASKEQVSAAEELRRERQQFEEQRQNLFSFLRDPDRFGKYAQPPEGDQPDPYTPEGVAWLVQKAFAERMNGFFKDYSEGLAAKDQELAQARQQAAAAAKKAEAQAYWDEHREDFTNNEIYDEIKELLDLTRDEKGVPRMSLQDAHRRVMAGRGRAPSPAQQARREAQQLSTPRSVRGAKVPVAPRTENLRKLGEWYRQNPDAMAADLERFQREGTGY